MTPIIELRNAAADHFAVAHAHLHDQANPNAPAHVLGAALDAIADYVIDRANDVLLSNINEDPDDQS